MKYIFTEESSTRCGVTVKRIKRVDTGELGGWIEAANNLSVAGYAVVEEVGDDPRRAE